jgi:hypothetical protein
MRATSGAEFGPEDEDEDVDVDPDCTDTDGMFLVLVVVILDVYLRRWTSREGEATRGEVMAESWVLSNPFDPFDPSVI